MPWGWECRAKLVKQLPAKPAERRGPVSGEAQFPGPSHYEAPQIFCGKGFSKIKRAPAYTFGHLTPVTLAKPVTTPNAKMFNVQGLGKNGPFRITHSVVTPALNPPTDKLKVPGPGTYAPRFSSEKRYKRPPAYTMRPAARPPYQPWDMWTPSPNMYCPDKPFKKAPAFTIGYMARNLKPQDLPGPGEHDPNFNYVKKNKPAYSFGSRFKHIKPPKTPPPNTYCEKKFMSNKRTIPAPSFGIRHTPYLGKFEVAVMPSKLNLIANS